VTPQRRRQTGITIGALRVGGLGFGALALTFLAIGPAEQTAAGVRAAEHHVHIQSEGGAETVREVMRIVGGGPPPETVQATTAADVLEALDAASIQRGLVLSVAYMMGMPDAEVEDEYAKVRAENDYVAEQVATAPDRLVGACSVNPLADYALDEIRRCAQDPRLNALKLHFANSDLDLRNEAHVERLASVFGTLSRLELPAVVHVRTRRPDYGAEDADIFIREVLSRAPRLIVQIAHMAGWGGYDEATDAALGAFAAALADGRLDPDLVTFDLAAVVFQPEAAGADTAMARSVREANQRLAARIREIGVERVVFATDWPSWPPTADPRLKIDQNARLVEAELPLTPDELARIFANANAIARDRR
jgi:predicted TIM-barrel fold metal-dependent hydrolase